MFNHYIIMSSAYSIGKRIAIDFCCEKDELGKVKEKVDKILNVCRNDVSLSTHLIQTSSESWNSVFELDPFFKDVELLTSEEEFIDLILKDRDLNSGDIASYVLSKYQCTHLKLEKLVYMCYADYLCQYHEKLFIDNIYSYQHGPVIETVYEKYKSYGYNTIEENRIFKEQKLESPAKSRILASRNGVLKLISIEKTLAKYGEKSAGKLVELTHRTSSPWNMAGAGKYINKEITDDIILKYHDLETI